MTILCLDIGTKRIGVAVSDPLGISAHGVATIKRQNREKDFEEILKFVRETEAQKIIIGLPLDEEGEVGDSAKKILIFLTELECFLKDQGLEIPLETWDERYSTAEAEEHLLKFDVSRRKRKRVIDKMAAVMILRDYLASKGI
jgi:putative Holliday junction resolvase